MKELNELVAIAERADAYGNLMNANPHKILAIAEAFRELEQRAEAAEAKLETENKWRDLALQFDGHRMQAISLLKMIVNDAPEKQFTSVRNFLKCGPLSGEEVMNERLLVIANSRPAPAISLAELVPDECEPHQSGLYGCKLDMRLKTPDWAEGFSACRAAILRNIEEAK